MRQFLTCLCAVYLVGSFQSVSTAAELEGLIVYFAFEGGAGKTVKDLSGNKQDGKLEGDTSWTDGKFGKAVDLGGKMGLFGLNTPMPLNLPTESRLLLGLNLLWRQDLERGNSSRRRDRMSKNFSRCCSIQTGLYGWDGN